MAGLFLWDERAMDLFGGEDFQVNSEADSALPLAARMRPRTLDELVGQEEILGEGKLLRRVIESDEFSSMIFWGPPGCGKSTLASIIARRTSRYFENYSAVTSGVADIRKVIESARLRKKATGQRTILFVDEIHRFNKAQQDAFLPHVEDGTIALIGATTENPYFEVNSPLISRSRIFVFSGLGDEKIQEILHHALNDAERGLGKQNIEADEAALAHLAKVANGDARNALNALELAAASARVLKDRRRVIDLQVAEEAIQQRALGYDKQGDTHYDCASAFIKSLRGSDPDAALYWMARMIEAGEDPKFIVRRLIVHASEDVGNADPMALVLATSAMQALQFVGLPEARIPIAQAVIYIACAPKSNATITAIDRAMTDVKNRRTAAVPKHLCDSHYPGAKKLGHGAGYKYPHDFPGNYVPQEYLPEGAKSQPYYEPTDNGHEARIKDRLRKLRGE